MCTLYISVYRCKLIELRGSSDCCRKQNYAEQKWGQLETVGAPTVQWIIQPQLLFSMNNVLTILFPTVELSAVTSIVVTACVWSSIVWKKTLLFCKSFIVVCVRLERKWKRGMCVELFPLKLEKSIFSTFVFTEWCRSKQRSLMKGNIQGDAHKFLGRFKRHFGSRISSESSKQDHIISLWLSMKLDLRHAVDWSV